MKKRVIILLLASWCITSYSQKNGTFKDPRDGKVYKTVKISTQTWFAENLAYKVDSGCWAYDNKDSNVVKYGYLYNWETAKTVCPTGWHLPSDAEWTTLINYIGGDTIAGVKMKAKTDWHYDASGNATNESGFNALPAGHRYYDGSFYYIGVVAVFWSSTPKDSEFAWKRTFYYNDGGVSRRGFNRTYGYSIRCAKD